MGHDVPSIKVQTTVVPLDVFVTDRNGSPITDLRAEDFEIREDGKRQHVSSFEAPQSRRLRTSAPVPPPNVFSNRPEYQNDRTHVTILLIDALNSPPGSLSQARAQIADYFRHRLEPDERVAVFLLSDKLTRLQDFTADQLAIRKAIDVGNAVSTLGATSTYSSPRTSGAVKETSAVQILQFLENMERARISFTLRDRIAATLSALYRIALATGAQHGQKSLIWISGGFPLSVAPETGLTADWDPMNPQSTPTGQPQMAMEGFEESARRLTGVLCGERITIYPIDVRGVRWAAGTDASDRGTDQYGLLMLGPDYAKTITDSSFPALSSKTNMENLARLTGGKAFLGTNDINSAFSQANKQRLASYSLSYGPSNKGFDGKFRAIQVHVARPGVIVRTRAGYYAVRPMQAPLMDGSDKDLAVAISDSSNDRVGILFDARLRFWQRSSNQQALAVDFLVDPATFVANLEGPTRHIRLDLYAALFGMDGRLVGHSTGITVDTSVDGGAYDEIRKRGLQVPMEMPDEPGDYTLRLAVRDNFTGKIGTVTIPLTRPD